MFVLICDKCAKVFGCRPHYYYRDNLMIRLCGDCPASEYCSNYGGNAFSINQPQEMDGGFCPDCIERGGGL